VTPLAEYAAPDALADQLRDLRSWRWTPLALMAVYVLSAAFMFPNTVLNLGTVLGLGGFRGAAYALAGSLLSATVYYAVGRRLPEPRASTRRGAWLLRVMDGVHQSLADGRIVSVLTLRLLPLAPFTIVNIAAGAVRVPLRSYVIGSFLAFLPGIAAVALLGRSLRDMLLTPGPASTAFAVAVILLSVAGVWLARRRLPKAKIPA
jgi:uncharacterized membrane protein YdjX (TVP38/TMEM64 family)